MRLAGIAFVVARNWLLIMHRHRSSRNFYNHVHYCHVGSAFSSSLHIAIEQSSLMKLFHFQCSRCALFLERASLLDPAKHERSQDFYMHIFQHKRLLMRKKNFAGTCWVHLCFLAAVKVHETVARKLMPPLQPYMLRNRFRRFKNIIHDKFAYFAAVKWAASPQSTGGEVGKFHQR